MDPALQELMAEGAPEDEVAVVMRLTPDAEAPVGVRLVARFGDIATCRVQRGDVLRVRAQATVASMKAPRRYAPEIEAGPRLPRADAGAESAEGGDDEDAESLDTEPRPGDGRRPPELASTGREVLVAHIDWGADIAHPDFRHPDGRTRFAAIWDQGAPYDPACPNRYGYGRIHLADEIDRALQADDPYAALGYHPARGKPAGGSHGSHTLGISAGNGRSGGPMGLAPEAVLAFVDLSTHQQAGDAGLGDSAALIEALDYLAELAAQCGARRPGGQALPLVVNASLGRQAGQHDGKTLTEQAMDAFLQAAPGRAIVQSTGNYFNRRIHASGLLRPGETEVLGLQVPPPPHPVHEVDLWYPGADRIAVSVQGPHGMPALPVSPGPAQVLLYQGRAVGRAYHRLADPNNGDNQVALYLDADAPDGRWTLRLEGSDVVDGRFHAWVERGPGSGAAQAHFVADDDSPCCTLGTICNGLRTLAVGAIDAHQPAHPLAPFSSGGPTRDGRGKPDLVAPGHHVLSARSAAADGGAGPLLKRMSGTSMAAPHVTGTIALMFAAARRPLAIHETRRLLLANTRAQPPEADAVQRWRRGCGELDTRAAVQAAAALDTPLPAPDIDDAHLRSPVMNTPTRLELEAAEAAAGLAYAEALAPLRAPRHCGCGECAECAAATAEAAELAEPAAAAAAPAATAPHEAAEPAACANCGAAAALAAPPPGRSGSAAEFVEATRADDRWRHRLLMRRDPAAMPFQFQIPLGGGAPALAMPIGGAGSPLAVTLPLGGPPAAPAAAAPAAAPAAPPSLPNAGAGAAAPTATVGGDAPVVVATSIDVQAPAPAQAAAGPAAAPATEAAANEAEPWLPSETTRDGSGDAGVAMLRAAEAACAETIAPRSSAQLVGRLLDAADAGGALLARLGRGAAPSATALFNTFVHPDAHPMRRRLLEHYQRHLQRLAGPGDALDAVDLRAGDWLLRVALGQGFGQLAVVASPMACRRDELAAWGWRTGGQRVPAEGRYLQVVEVLPLRHPASERWARRVADARGRLLADSLLLRPQPSAQPLTLLAPAEDFVEAIAEDAAADMRWLQHALNQVLGTQLAVDGVAGPQTRSAIRQFQASRGLAVDGIAGPRTQAALRSALQGDGGGAGQRVSPPAGPPSAPGLGPDCSMLTHFPQGRDDLSPAHQMLLIAAATRILAERIRTVMITGFASSEGGDADNFVLGMRRADRVARELRATLDRMRPGFSAGVAMITSSRGESEQIAGGDFGLNRRVTLCLQVPRPVPPRPRPVPEPDPVETQVFRVTAKSFIGPIGSNVGSLDCGIDIGPVRIPGASNLALRALALATDQAFSEDPTSDAIFSSPPPENKGYRLFSRGELNVQRRGGEAVSVTLAGGGLTTDSGKECVPGTGVCLQAPPLIVDQAFSTRRVDASRIAFRWGVKGRPPTTVEPGFNAICHRDSVFIWHQVKGTIDCSSGSAVVTHLVVEGSRFPTHRVWLDGTMTHEVLQGPFSNLWDSAAGDPTRVR